MCFEGALQFFCSFDCVINNMLVCKKMSIVAYIYNARLVTILTQFRNIISIKHSRIAVRSKECEKNLKSFTLTIKNALVWINSSKRVRFGAIFRHGLAYHLPYGIHIICITSKGNARNQKWTSRPILEGICTPPQVSHLNQ